MSANAYMHGQDLNGNWVPYRVDTAGGAAGGGGGVVLFPWSYVAAAGGITNTSDVTLVAAAGAGKSNYITSIQLHNKSATATEVEVKSGATVLWRGYAPASGVGPVTVSFGTPLASAANTALTAACVTTATATLINAQGFKDVSPLGVTTLISDAEEIFAGDGTLLTTAGGETIYLH